MKAVPHTCKHVGYHAENFMSFKKDQYLTDLWNQVIQYLNTNRIIETELIDTFFSLTYIYEINEDKAIISVANSIQIQVLKSYSDKISEALANIMELHRPITVEFYLESNINKISSSKNISFDENEFHSMNIQKDRTFDNFVVGDCNRESQAAVLACAHNPGKFFNPLFIYGNSGLGKTHLLMSIANYVLKSNPDKRVYYTESLKFVETVVNAIRDNRIEEFKRYMFSMDLLLVDDIQFLAGKEKSHEVFFTIYNELVNNGKQVCIASDRQPREIKGLEDRLISRFSSGLSVGIDSPEFETSLAILQMKIRQNGYGIEDCDEEGLAYIASNFSGNVRDLEGAWNRVLFFAIQFQPDGKSIRFETVMNALKSQAVVSDKTGLSPRKIIKAVADYYGLTRQQITSKTRTKNISNARHISIYLCRKLLNISYIKIGEEFGGRDHSTIMSACTKVEKQIKKDTVFENVIKEIENQLNV